MWRLWFWNFQFLIFRWWCSLLYIYGVYISQLIRFDRASSHVGDFNTRNILLTQELPKQGYRYHKLWKHILNFIDDTIIWYLNSKLDLNLSCAKDFWTWNSLVTWCVNWRTLLALIIFQRSSLKNSHYKKIGYNINVLQQNACFVVNTITVGNFVFLFNCTLVGRTSDSMMVPT